MAGQDLVPVNVSSGSNYTLAEINSIGDVFAKSGYFKDATDVAKAITKVLAGQELGLGPMQSMVGIHIVQGKPTLSASLVGAMIKRSGRYDYRVGKLTDQECVLTFFERGERVGESAFSMDDAKAAGLLSNATWKNYPRNMLHSRALTNGARWYCPDVFGGAIYTPDEMGAAIDGATGDAIVVEEAPAPPPPPPSEPPKRAAKAQRDEIEEMADALIERGVMTLEKFRAALLSEYGHAALRDLDGVQADELRARLQKALDAQPPQEEAPPLDESQFQAPEGALT